MVRQPRHVGLRHLALSVGAYEETKQFYVRHLGFKVEWEPDDDNAYLTSGTDNLALHRAPRTSRVTETVLDHIGLLVGTAEDVDAWASYLEANGVSLSSQPRNHRDGARSFYFCDPDGNRIQIIHHPPISGP